MSIPPSFNEPPPGYTDPCASSNDNSAKYTVPPNVFCAALPYYVTNPLNFNVPPHISSSVPTQPMIPGYGYYSPYYAQPSTYPQYIPPHETPHCNTSSSPYYPQPFSYPAPPKPQTKPQSHSGPESTVLEPPYRPQSSTYSQSHNKSSTYRSQSHQKYSSRSSDYYSSDVNYTSSRSSLNVYPKKYTFNSVERNELLEKWRKNYCETTEDIARKLAELSNDEKECWIRSSPADIYYKRKSENEVIATPRLKALCNVFEEELVKRASKVKEKQELYVPPMRKRAHRVCKHRSEKCSSSSSSDEETFNFEDTSVEELSRKISHPYRLHHDLWYNDPGEVNDGPLCRCSAKSRRSGIRHGLYPGETGIPKCDPNSNNADKLYHYRITISPPTNFLTKTPTIIKHDEHEFIFEGFSLLSHSPIESIPVCKVIRFNIEYTILYIEEKMPENFVIQELDLFFEYLFHELLELVDFQLKPLNATNPDSCSMFHLIPRFVRDLPENGKEILAMSEVLHYLLDSSGPLVDRETLKEMMLFSQEEWQDYVDYVKGMIVTNPGMKPCSVRIDQLDRNVSDLPECSDVEEIGIVHPVIVHFGLRPPQLSYVGNPEYQKAWREYVKFRHLIANMSKPTPEDKRKLKSKENLLHEMRTQGRIKRNVTVAVTSKSFYRTGIMCDIVQHTMLIPVLACHLRNHRSMDYLEETIDYKFKNRYLLQLALTHPSYRENFGTNPDHARNSLTNCGIRQPEYGDRRIHYMNTKKRGINTLINIMSRFGKKYATDSNITHNERLEFLGDAVVEFLTSIHLFFMFPELEEGGLATYRAAIVQNQHLSVLAKKLHLDEYMLYAHGSDLCHELELRHAMANCFESLMGALLLDGGIEVADKVFGAALFMEDANLKETWENIPPHPLQEQEPFGDRKWIESYELLKNLTKFEESIGVEFRHIRLLTRAFTDRSIGFTHLTLGSNQRLEFLGDTVLQLICSEFLYRHFPEHHEGHLSLLRSSLVNNRTQAVVCDDLGMTQYAVYSNPKAELKSKDRADLLEAFLGALYVDKGLEFCQTFCHVCLFPRLQNFIMNQDWNDPKSKLQQCCLTLRTMDGGEPDIPVYKVIECSGPTNTRVYEVAVYFRGKRLASATGHSIQQAEMNAAKQALENSQDLFPQLDHQKRVIAQSIKRQKGDKHDSNNSLNIAQINERNANLIVAKAARHLSNLPKQYRPRDDRNSNLSDSDLSSIGSISSYEDVSQQKQKQKKKKKRKNRTKPNKIEDTKTIFQDNLEEITSSDSAEFNDFQEILSIDGNNTDKNGKHITDNQDSSMCNENVNIKTMNYATAVQVFKIEGTEDLSSDLESGEIYDF